MALLQGNEDIAVGGTGRSARVIREVNTAIRNPQVVDNTFKLVSRNDLPDYLLYLVGDSSRLLDASSCLHPYMHVETTGINRREEIFAEEWKQQQRNRRKPYYRKNGHLGMTQASAQKIPIALAEPAEAVFKGNSYLSKKGFWLERFTRTVARQLRRQQVLSKCWNDCAREEIGGGASRMQPPRRAARTGT